MNMPGCTGCMQIAKTTALMFSNIFARYHAKCLIPGPSFKPWEQGAKSILNGRVKDLPFTFLGGFSEAFGGFVEAHGRCKLRWSSGYDARFKHTD